ANLRRQIGGEKVDVVGEVLPDAGDAGNVRLAAQAAFDADLTRNGGDLLGEDAERIGHVVDRLGQRRDLAFRLDGQLLLQAAVGDGGDDFDDTADLRCKVGSHDVDVVGQIFPCAGDAGDDGLAAELAFGADLARDARDLRRERVQLIDHRIDRVFQLQDLAAAVVGDLFRQVAVGDGDGDVVGEVFPCAGDAGHHRLTSQFSFRADFARDARDFRREGVQLVDHRVDRVFQLKDLAADVDGDLLRQVAVGDRDGDVGDVSDLCGKITGHHVDGLG